MKTILSVSAVLLICLGSIQCQNTNYLTTALDAAMAMKANFDSNAAYYRVYVNYETEALARNLIELVAQAMERSSTEAQGAAITSCAHAASYYATGAEGTVLTKLEVIQDAALVYYRIILDELAKMNVFTNDFEIFYYQFNLRLNESYDHLNDVLLQDVINGLLELIDGSRVIFNTLDNCLNAI